MKYLLLLLASAVPCLGQYGLPGVSVTSTNKASALSWAIIPVEGYGDETPCVTYINAIGDAAGSVVKAYPLITAATYATAVNGTVTNAVQGTNGFSVNDIVIVRHMTNEVYERRIVSSMTASTNLVLTAATLQAVISGDQIFRVSTNVNDTAVIAVGIATNSVAGTALIIGRGGRPLLIEINGSSAASLNAATALFINPTKL